LFVLRVFAAGFFAISVHPSHVFLWRSVGLRAEREVNFLNEVLVAS
jgi:hypothetical protein